MDAKEALTLNKDSKSTNTDVLISVNIQMFFAHQTWKLHYLKQAIILIILALKYSWKLSKIIMSMKWAIL